jgi:hypothetical protein
MKVIRLPRAAEAEMSGRAAGEEIDAALNGEIAGAEATAVRELREDVRALAPALYPEFERELQARVAEWASVAKAGRRGRLRARVAGLRGWLRGTPGRLVALGGVGTVIAAFVVVLLVVGGRGGAISEDVYPAQNSVHAATRGGEPHVASAEAVLGEPGRHARKTQVKPSEPIRDPAETPAEAKGPNSSPSSAATAGPSHPAIERFSAEVDPSSLARGRLQQRAATVSLAPQGAQGVQEAADAVMRLAASDGGYVESSHVQVRQGAPSEAQLQLSVPSAKLSGAIAALGRIAPVRAVNQESHDITSSYDAARRRLSDDEAVRRALLRALAAASSEGRIDSLRERLSSNREVLSRDRTQLHSVTHTASTSQLEVTIAGGASTAAAQSTLDRGLHDAGHVLAVAAAVALVALAVIVPLGVIALGFETLRRARLRRRREAALEP